MFGGAFPVLAGIFGPPFLPSQNYVARFSMAAALFAVLSGLSALALLWGTGFLERAMRRTGQPHRPPFAKYLVLGFGPLMVAMLAYSLVIAALPMAHVLVAGRPAALTYTVGDAARSGGRECPGMVTLAAMPFIYAELCDVPAALRDSFEPGMPVELRGRATESGIFYREIGPGRGGDAG